MNSRRRSCLSLLLCLLLSPIVSAQAQSPTTNQPNPGKDIELLRNKAAEFFKRADYSSALEAMKQALGAAEAQWGDSHINITELLDLTAGVYRARGFYPDALALCKRSLAIREKALGPNHPNVATSLFTLASLYSDLGSFKQGLEMGSAVWKSERRLSAASTKTWRLAWASWRKST